MQRTPGCALLFAVDLLAVVFLVFFTMAVFFENPSPVHGPKVLLGALLAFVVLNVVAFAWLRRLKP